MESPRPIPRHSSTGATTLFFAAIILPLVFFLFTLSMDLRTYLLQRQSVQKNLDEAALYAYRFLNANYKDNSKGSIQAEERVKTLLKRYPDLEPFTTATLSSDFIQLNYSGTVPFSFARLFGGLTEGANPENSLSKASVPLYVSSRVRGTPFDTVIAIDRSYYLSPDILNQETWGNRAEWPESRFFRDEHPVVAKFFDPNIGTEREISVNPRTATQQCFNPAFSALKLAGVQVFDALNSFHLNYTSILFYPGGYSGVTILRDIHQQTSKPEATFTEIFQAQGTNGTQTLNDEYYDRDGTQVPRSVVLNNLCAACAESSSTPSNYWFPGRSDTGLDPLAGKPRMINTSGWTYDPAYDQFLLASEVIWSRSAIRSVGIQKEPSIKEVLDASFASVFSLDPLDSRSGLKGRSIKNILIFAGDVPRENGQRFEQSGAQDNVNIAMKESFQNFRNYLERINALAPPESPAMILNIYYLLFAHDGNKLAGESGRVADLRRFLDEESLFNGQKRPYFNMQLLYGEDPSSMAQGLVGILLLTQKSGVLSW